MTTVPSFNTIKLFLKDFADRHTMVRDYEFGPIVGEFSCQRGYLKVHPVPVTSRVLDNCVEFDLNIIVVDSVRLDDERMMDEVLSDTQQVIADIVRFCREQRERNDIWLVGTPSTQLILEDQKDRISGHSLTITLGMPVAIGTCGIPLEE